MVDIMGVYNFLCAVTVTKNPEPLRFVSDYLKTKKNIKACSKKVIISIKICY